MALPRAALLWCALFVSNAFAADTQSPLRPQIVVIEDHRKPVVWVRIAWPVGTHSRWWEKNQMDVVWSLLASHAEIVAPKASRLKAWATPYAAVLDLSFVAEDWDDVFAQLGHLRYKKIVLGLGRLQTRAVKKYYRREQKSSSTWLLDRKLARIFFKGTDPRRNAATLTGGRSVNSEHITRLLSEVFNLSGCVVGFAGDVDMQKARATKAELLMGEGRPLGKKMLKPAIRNLEGTRPAARYRVRNRLSDESLIAWSRPGLSWSDPQAPAAFLADSAVLSRVTLELRRNLGSTYTAWTDSILASEPAPYAIVTTSMPGQEGRSKSAMLGIFQGLSTDGLRDDEIEQARQRLGFQRRLRNQTPDVEMGARVLAALLPEGRVDPLQVEEKAMTVGKEEVQAFVKSFYAAPSFVEVQVRP